MPNVDFDANMFSDATFQLLCSQIDSDYTAILRRDILPVLGVDKSIKLRELRTSMILDSFEKPVASSVVSHYLRFDKGTVSRAAKVLRDLDYIENLPNPSDKRSPLLRLTRKGRTLARKYTTTVTQHFSKLAEEVGEQFTEEETRIAVRVLFLLRNRTKQFAGYSELA